MNYERDAGGKASIRGGLVALLSVSLLVLAGALVERWTGASLVATLGLWLERLRPYLERPVSLPTWAWLLTFIVGFVAALLTRLLAERLRRRPSFRHYISDQFYDVNWHWRWQGKEVDEDSITAMCPSCGEPLTAKRVTLEGDLVFDPEGVKLTCSRCGYAKRFNIGSYGLLGRVASEIRRRARTGRYQRG